MEKKSYKWLARLVDKITKDGQSNNDYFVYYGHKVTLSSGTRNYVSVIISDSDYENEIDFSYDYWTQELCFESYPDYDLRDAIIKAFKDIYNYGLGRIVIAFDKPWDDEMNFYEPMIGNDEYDQENVMKEYNELLSRKAA